MTDLVVKSPIQFEHRPDGSVQLAGRPDVTLKTHEQQATATFPDWYRQLGLPTYQEQWDALAVATSLNERFIQFCLCDESPTKHAGNVPLQPALIRVHPVQRYRLILGHTQYVIGEANMVLLIPRSLTQANRPGFVTGDCLVGTAELYDSKLADLAWRGLQQGIFSHSCAVVAQQPGDPVGAGDLVEIALVSEAEAACPGAKVLRWWEA
jgi:hypothetical protein